MATKIFVNLPVKDLVASKTFFGSLGFKFNPQFTDQNAACLVVNDDIYVMLLSEKRFQDFTKKTIADATKTTEVLTCLSLDSKEQVNEMADAALQAGATVANPPMDHGFMYGRSFNDLDGHIWEIVWVDPTQPGP